MWGYDYWPPKEEKPLTKPCTCGMVVTYGEENVPLEQHSSWCDKVRKDEEKKDDNSQNSKRND